jgi:inosine/xanthosine triphosphate pyrophosphatase family protein
LSTNEKNRISHRAQACQLLLAALSARYGIAA